MEINKVTVAIIKYIQNVDLLDYPYGLQIVEEELSITNFTEKNKVLRNCLIKMIKDNQIIVGEYMTADEIKPWSHSSSKCIDILNNKTDLIIETGKVSEFFWIGLPSQKYLGH